MLNISGIMFRRVKRHVAFTNHKIGIEYNLLFGRGVSRKVVYLGEAQYELVWLWYIRTEVYSDWYSRWSDYFESCGASLNLARKLGYKKAIEWINGYFPGFKNDYHEKRKALPLP